MNDEPKKQKLKHVELSHQGAPQGDALIAALEASPHRDLELTPKRMPMPVRKVEP